MGGSLCSSHSLLSLSLFFSLSLAHDNAITPHCACACCVVVAIYIVTDRYWNTTTYRNLDIDRPIINTVHLDSKKKKTMYQGFLGIGNFFLLFLAFANYQIYSVYLGQIKIIRIKYIRVNRFWKLLKIELQNIMRNLLGILRLELVNF